MHLHVRIFFFVILRKIYNDIFLIITAFDHQSACIECQTTIENWICLICFNTFCSRYVNEHCLMHSISTDHPLVLSFSDLSVWCHKCEDYIDNPKLHKFKNLAYKSKFNEELVWSYDDQNTIDLTFDDDDSE